MYVLPHLTSFDVWAMKLTCFPALNGKVRCISCHNLMRGPNSNTSAGGGNMTCVFHAFASDVQLEHVNFIAQM